MEIEDEYYFARSRLAVWEAIHNPTLLREIIPGCESFIREEGSNGDIQFHATILVRFGPLKIRLQGLMELSDVQRARAYRLTVKGVSGWAKWVHGFADIDLKEEAPNATRLCYRASATLSGQLGKLSLPMMKETARKWARVFFKDLEQKIPLEQSLETPSAGLVPLEVPYQKNNQWEELDDSLALHPLLWQPLIIAIMALLLVAFYR